MTQRFKDSKQAMIYLLKGYTQEDILSYQDQLDNDFYGDEPLDFEEYIEDIRGFEAGWALYNWEH